jgi:L-fuconolactonase
MMRTASTHPWITGIVGWLPLREPVITARILENHYGPTSLLKGVRHLIHNESDPRWLLQDTVLESLGLLAASDIPYDLVGILPAHIQTALEVAEKWPALRMVFDHFNQPPIGRVDKNWQRLMQIAARHPNFYVKISGLGTAARKGTEWTSADLEPCIEFALHAFGEDRCFCGGDWPVSLLAGSYEKAIDAYRSLIGKYLDQNAQKKLLYKNAERFYKLPL